MTHSQTAAVCGASPLAKDGASLTLAGGGAVLAPGDFSRERAIHREILRAFVAGEPYAPMVRAIATACGTGSPKVVSVIADLLARELIVGERCQVGGAKRLKVTAVRPWQDPPPPKDVADRAATVARMSSIRFEDDPRAIRDTGTPGKPWLHAQSNRSLGGYVQYGR